MNKRIVSLCLAAVLLTSGCDRGANGHAETAAEKENAEMGMMSMHHHSDSGEVPKGLREAEHPTYHVGDTVVIHAKHMAGMDGATGKVVGAYDTVAYSVTYTPTDGGKPVRNHKWVIQEEIKDAGNQPLEPGQNVILEADHMEGMMGAQATIETADRTTVYMVDYIPTNGGAPVTNHKWVVERELSERLYKS
ncbi:YdhK family protein [Paenibacillus sp. FSL M7-1455]|uniref:YdhK family protein n=1 Tax=Paenibacillus sp. FSL M7-1455 TaxID=2975316 RepID=UPI0030F5A6A7